MTDEAKWCVKALRACDLHKNIQPVAFFVCSDCPGYEPDTTCRINLTAADLIESLAAELEQVKQERDGLSILLCQAQSMLETRTRERDAAVKDIYSMKACALCKHYPSGEECETYFLLCIECDNEKCICKECSNGEKMEWRGIKEG